VKLNDSLKIITFWPTQSLKKCFSIEAPNNTIVDEVKHIQFQISMEGSNEIKISPSLLSVDVLDNDGKWRAFI